MDQYCILGRIGEGAHGIVFKAKHVETGEIVALKKVALRRLEDGIPNQALREIKAPRGVAVEPGADSALHPRGLRCWTRPHQPVFQGLCSSAPACVSLPWPHYDHSGLTPHLVLPQ
uniref:Cyclin dependent kinase 20 n=1 Tax=Molossus molossus TaxID=27622 RepID=A0A7J8ECM4_MOLMO|nr:cyclin dependent kinase 20 [Molossus molossus]